MAYDATESGNSGLRSPAVGAKNPPVPTRNLVRIGTVDVTWLSGYARLPMQTLLISLVAFLRPLWSARSPSGDGSGFSSHIKSCSAQGRVILHRGLSAPATRYFMLSYALKRSSFHRTMQRRLSSTSHRIFQKPSASRTRASRPQT